MKDVGQQKQSMVWKTVASGTEDTPLEHHPATPEAKTSQGESVDSPSGHGRPVTPLVRHRRARRTFDSESSGGWLWSLP